MPIIAATGRSGFLSRSIEVAASLATLVVAVLLSVVLVKTYLAPAPSPRITGSVRPADLVAPGTNLAKRVPDIDWNKHGGTLVLALSTHCHFCTESAPFFRQIKERIGKDVKLVGVLPEPVAEAESYLSREGVQLDEVRQIPLGKVGVTGTPPMLLVNSKGIVTQTWVGKLAPDKQEEALKTIGEVRANKS